jgi:hypothetical protein
MNAPQPEGSHWQATLHDEKFLATLVAGIGRTKRSTRAVDDDQLIEK